MKRREAREKALQTLFQMDNTGLTLDEAIIHVNEGKSNDFFEGLVRGTVENMSEIDESLRGKIENWSLDRLPKIERTILRMSLYELLYMKDAPAKVVMNEAIELSKLYGDEQSSRFVNGVLSKFSAE
ncbi:transcription antitermination factor NusB [Chungangia koreensis]|uniref:Transcription antitermination protein NusB n=1 Tax=Chungangia koreensis TaxID=752657 RepID=A0ABV8X7L5_9LACT